MSAVRVFGMRMFLDDSPVSKKIQRRKVYEAKETKLIQEYLKPGMRAIDVGAHIGYHTLIMAKNVSDGGWVVSFEPDSDNYRILTDNVTANELKNVLSFNGGLFDEHCRKPFYKCAGNSGDNRMYKKNPGEKATEAAFFKFDDFRPILSGATVMRHGGDIDFVKVDTQGAELRVLEGMSITLTEAGPMAMLVEFYPYGLRKFKSSPDDLFDFISSRGFRIYDIKKDMHEIDNFHAATRFYTKGNRFTNLWCVRK